MKHLKRFLAISLAVLLLFSLAACGENEESAPRTAPVVDYSGEKISVALSNTAADYGFAKLIDNDIYTFSTQDNLLEKMTSDLAVLPLWRVAELSASDPGFKILAILTFGQYSVLTNGEEISGVKDLDGKTVTFGQAYPASAESLSRVFDQTGSLVQTLLDKYNVKASVENDLLQNVFDKITAGSVQIAVLPEPYASLASANSDAEVAFTLTNAFSDAGEKAPLVEYCLVAKDGFLTKNPQGVEKVLADLRASVEWINLNPQDAVDLLIEKGYVDASVLQTDPDLAERKQESAKKQLAVDLIARSNIVLIEGESMISAISEGAYLQQQISDELIYISK